MIEVLGNASTLLLNNWPPTAPSSQTDRAWQASGDEARRLRNTEKFILRWWPPENATSQQPTAPEPGAAQSGNDVRTIAHQPPQHASVIVLDHQHDRALVKSKVPW